MPGDLEGLSADRRAKGIDFVARYVPWTTLNTLLRYQISAAGRRFAAESRRAEPRVAALFREPATLWAIDHACRSAFDDRP